MPIPLVVLDTNVLAAAIHSRRGASYAVLKLVGTGRFDIAVSVPLVLEYEDALLRRRGHLSAEAVRNVVDFLCNVAKRQEIYFLWRPLLPDPKDDMVAEVAIASGAEAVVTYNRRDFAGLERFDVMILSPHELLKKIGERP